MEEWIRILVAFVHEDEEYEFGTSSLEQIKVMTSKGTIEVQDDQRWEELTRLGEVFAQGES